MTCFSLTDSQDTRIQIPAVDEAAIEQWIPILSVQESSTAEASVQEPETTASLSEQLNTLKTVSENERDEDWLDSCDALWESLAQKQTVYTEILDLDSFLNIYTAACDRLNRPDRIQLGLDAYISLMLDDLKVSDAEKLTLFDQVTRNLLLMTSSYDSQIAEFYYQIAEILTENLDSYETEEEISNSEYVSFRCRIFADLLSGKASALTADEVRENANAQMMLLSEIVDLAEGNIQAAVDDIRYDIAQLLTFAPEDDIESVISSLLQDIYVLEQREIVPQSVANEFLKQCPFTAGISLQSVSDKALELGLYKDDLIYAVNGTYLTSLRQTQDIFESSETRILDVYGKDESVRLEKSDGSTLFSAEFEIRLHQDSDI